MNSAGVLADGRTAWTDLKSSFKPMATPLILEKTVIQNFSKFRVFGENMVKKHYGYYLNYSKVFWGADLRGGGFNEASSLINPVFLSLRSLYICKSLGN